MHNFCRTQKNVSFFCRGTLLMYWKWKSFVVMWRHCYNGKKRQFSSSFIIRNIWWWYTHATIIFWSRVFLGSKKHFDWITKIFALTADTNSVTVRLFNGLFFISLIEKWWLKVIVSTEQNFFVDFFWSSIRITHCFEHRIQMTRLSRLVFPIKHYLSHSPRLVLCVEFYGIFLCLHIVEWRS